MKSRRIDPIFQTRHKQVVIVDGKVIGEIYTLPKAERRKGVRKRIPRI